MLVYIILLYSLCPCSQRCQNHAAYYRNALRYLGCMELDDIPGAYVCVCVCVCVCVRMSILYWVGLVLKHVVNVPTKVMHCISCLFNT